MARVPPITALIWVAACLVITVEIVVTVLALYSVQRGERTDAMVTLERIARGSEADINQRLLGIDSMLLGLGNLLSLTGENEDASGRAFADLLSELRNQNPLLQDVLLFDRDGAAGPAPLGADLRSRMDWLNE